LENLKYLLILIIFLLLSIVSGCTTEYPNRMLVGEPFPRVSGQSLEKQSITFPQVLDGRNVVLLLGYVQDAQFDIDRWLIGLDMTQTQVDVYELPTIQGMFPRFFKTQINEGMRKGIPKDLWKGVVTIYDDGEKVQKFTGNINPNNARVILLAKDGDVAFFYDGGFSVSAIKSLKSTIDSLNTNPKKPYRRARLISYQVI
jgi:hypothetical protein